MGFIPFTVSFDALGTLIQVTDGVGCQYRAAFATFLRQFGIDFEATFPNASCERVEEIALKAIRAEMAAERASWTATSNPKEMPSGGSTEAEVEQFWGKVFARVFQNPSLYQGAPPATVQRIMSLWTAEAESMRRFEHYVVFDLFASTKTQSWLPEGLRTLQSLRTWNQQRLQQHVRSSQDTASASLSSSSSSSMLVLVAPPFVVSNMDPRVRAVFDQLGAFTPGEQNEPPLLSRVIAASDIGLAKPSPQGLLTGVRDINASIAAAAPHETNSLGEAEMRYHVHVGDAEADRIASEKAGCVYLKCDATVGAKWEQLRAKLEEMEALCRR
ncbi:hypothetical protein NQL31_008094 [Lotmaria passim]